MPGAAAAGDRDDGVGGVLDPLEVVEEDRGVGRRPSVLRVAGMEVDDRRAGLDCVDGLRDDVFDGVGQVRRHRRRVRADPVTAHVMMTLRGSAMGFLLRVPTRARRRHRTQCVRTMRAAVASCETLLRNAPFVKGTATMCCASRARPASRSSGGSVPVSRAAPSRDLGSSLDRDRARAPRTARRAPGHRPPDAEHGQSAGRPSAPSTGADTPYSVGSSSPAHSAYPRSRVSASSSTSTLAVR